MYESIFQINLNKERERGYLTSSLNKCQDEKKDLGILSPSLPYLTCDPSSHKQSVQCRNSTQPPSCPHWHTLAQKPHCATITYLSNTRSVLKHQNWACAIPKAIFQPPQLAPVCPFQPSFGVTPGVSACAGSGCSPSEGASGSLWGPGFSCLQVVLHEPVGSLPPWPGKTKGALGATTHGQGLPWGEKIGTKIRFILEMCMKEGMVRTEISDKISQGETGQRIIFHVHKIGWNLFWAEIKGNKDHLFH